MNDKEMWNYALQLWKRIASMPNESISNQTDFKDKISLELGLPKFRCGCSFCEKYFKDDCDGCPISERHIMGCLDYTPYKEWTYKVHDQELAKAFYEYLREKCPYIELL